MNSGNKPRHLKKIVAIGASCGKTTTINTYIIDEFLEGFHHYVERYKTEIAAYGDYVETEIYDTNGNDAFENIRRFYYKNTDVFIIFFSVYSRKTFNDVKDKWVPEVKECCPHVPFILVGTTAFLGVRLTDGEKVTLEQGRALAKEVGAAYYLECWPDRKYNVERVFVEAIAATLKYDK